MNVKAICDGEYIKGAIADLSVSDLLLISAALHDFAENEDRHAHDRADAERMIRDIHFAIGKEP